MDKKVRAHVMISGRVQGVFFRAETQRAVQGTGVSGWVRNRPEGSVEAVFEGLQQDVDKAVAWCHTGSPMARVTDVQVSWEVYTGEYSTFEVTY